MKLKGIYTLDKKAIELDYNATDSLLKIDNVLVISSGVGKDNVITVLPVDLDDSGNIASYDVRKIFSINREWLMDLVGECDDSKMKIISCEIKKELSIY